MSMGVEKCDEPMTSVLAWDGWDFSGSNTRELADYSDEDCERWIPLDNGPSRNVEAIDGDDATHVCRLDDKPPSAADEELWNPNKGSLRDVGADCEDESQLCHACMMQGVGSCCA